MAGVGPAGTGDKLEVAMRNRRITWAVAAVLALAALGCGSGGGGDDDDDDDGGDDFAMSVVHSSGHGG
ncbi:hypothetical protein GCM10010201_20290 [Pilimelia columellifera subsp. columellifera]|uniref:Uncharacterized protein n=2 Tax=Pilimelia TaxID=53370 RepID=A0ABP6AT75_9ACTN